MSSRPLNSLAIFCVLLGICAPADAAPPVNVPEMFTRLPTFKIPFNQNPGSRVRDVEFYVSTDGGRNWTYVSQAAPSNRKEDNKFNYTAPSDGTYWFAVRSIDQNNVAAPPTLTDLQPGLVIHLDRRPPIAQLKAAAPRGPNVVGVEWDVRDENFDPTRFVLDYRVPGQSDWKVQDVDAKSSGTAYWQLTTAPSLEVRLRVADRAGNDAETTLSLQPGSSGTSTSTNNTTGTSSDPSPNSFGSTSPSTPPGRPAIHYINSLQVALPFRISNVGVSGVPTMDLWYTRDMGRNWQKMPRTNDDASTHTPGDGVDLTKQFTFTAPGEGLYGFTVVVRSGVGIGDADPRPGEAPKQLVEVDITKPEIEMHVSRGAGNDVRNVTIEWTSRDKNLAERPVTLLHSASKEGPWEPIITDQEARGRYVWTITDQGPFQFYVQARVADKAGNTSVATSQDRITVDLSRPKAELQIPVPVK